MLKHVQKRIKTTKLCNLTRRLRRIPIVKEKPKFRLMKDSFVNGFRFVPFDYLENTLEVFCLVKDFDLNRFPQIGNNLMVVYYFGVFCTSNKYHKEVFRTSRTNIRNIIIVHWFAIFKENFCNKIVIIKHYLEHQEQFYFDEIRQYYATT